MWQNGREGLGSGFPPAGALGGPCCFGQHCVLLCGALGQGPAIQNGIALGRSVQRVRLHMCEPAHPRSTWCGARTGTAGLGLALGVYSWMAKAGTICAWEQGIGPLTLQLYGDQLCGDRPCDEPSVDMPAAVTQSVLQHPALQNPVVKTRAVHRTHQHGERKKSPRPSASSLWLWPWRVHLSRSHEEGREFFKGLASNPGPSA